jgi:PAS domain-containing protein
MKKPFTEDRPHVLAKLEEATRTGRGSTKRFRIWPGSALGFGAGFPVRDSDGSICRLVGTAQDITAQKKAEEQVAKNLALAEGAWARSSVA